MSKYIAHIVCSGTKIEIPISAKNVDSGMLKLRKMRVLRKDCYLNAAILFFSRKTGKLEDVRSF